MTRCLARQKAAVAVGAGAGAYTLRASSSPEEGIKRLSQSALSSCGGGEGSFWLPATTASAAFFSVRAAVDP